MDPLPRLTACKTNRQNLKQCSTAEPDGKTLVLAQGAFHQDSGVVAEAVGAGAAADSHPHRT